MIFRIILRILPALLHSILSIGYIHYIFSPDGNLLETRLIVGFFVLLVINSIASTMVSKGQWRQLPITLISFVFFFALNTFLLSLTGQPTHHIDDDPGNPGIGFVIIVAALPLSIMSLLFGTMIGITVVQLRQQLKTFYKGRVS